MRRGQSQQTMGPLGKKISVSDLSELPNGSVLHSYAGGKLDRVALIVKNPIGGRTLGIYFANKNKPGTWQKKPLSSQHLGLFLDGRYGDYYLQDEVALAAPGPALAERMAVAARRAGLSEERIKRFVSARFDGLASRYVDEQSLVSDKNIAAFLRSFISMNRIDTEQTHLQKPAETSVQDEKIADQALAKPIEDDSHAGFAVGDRVSSTNKNTGLGLVGEVKEISRTPDGSFRHFVVAWDGGGRGLLGPNQIALIPKEVQHSGLASAILEQLQGVETFAFIGDRAQAVPQNVPGDWLVFNAPRPILGDIEWQGDFWHGRFYVAIDPAGERAEDLIRRTHELDGWLVRYFTEPEVKDLAFQWAEQEYPQYVQGGQLVDDSVSEEDIVETFKNHFEGKKKYGELPENEKRWVAPGVESESPDLEQFSPTR